MAVDGCHQFPPGIASDRRSRPARRLIARDGSELASGNTQGGGVDGPAAFNFTVPYSVDARQIGHLEVFEEDVSDGEGFPPGRTVVPLVLNP